MPYAHFDFNVYFFQNSFHSYFWGKFGLKICSSSNLLKFGTEVDYHILISILMFIFSKFFSFIFLRQIWSQNLKFFRLTEIWYRDRLPYTHFSFNVYFFKILFTHIFGENLIPKSEVFRLIEIWYRGRLSYAYFDFNVYVFKILFTHIFGTNLVPKSEVLQID